MNHKLALRFVEEGQRTLRCNRPLVGERLDNYKEGTAFLIADSEAHNAAEARAYKAKADADRRAVAAAERDRKKAEKEKAAAKAAAKKRAADKAAAANKATADSAGGK